MSSLRSFLAVLLLTAGAFLLGTYVSPTLKEAEAHSAGSFFSHKWGSGTSAVQIGVGGPVSAIGSFPSQNAAAATMESNANSAGNRWDNITSAGNWSNFTGGNYYDSSISYSSNPCDSRYYSASIEVWLHAAPLSSQAGNQTECEFVFLGDPLISKSNIRFDTSNRTWAFGGPGGGAGTTHFIGIAVHELGHSTGFDGHFSKPSPQCASTASTGDHTMCSAFTNSGRYWRTLETHDIHTFQNAY